MYEPLWRMLEETISGPRARRFTRAINAHARWCTSTEWQETAETAADIMRRIGLQHVELIPMPADGTTSFCGWVNPVAWDVRDATLEIVRPVVKDKLLAQYRSDPYSLMVRSAPTPPEGVTAPLVLVDNSADPSSYRGKNVAGKIALIDSRGYPVSHAAFDSRVSGLVADNLPVHPFTKPESESRDWRFWHGFTLPTWKTTRTGFGFSITPRQGKRLRRWLAEGADVVLKARVDSRLYSGTLNVVTGLLPGTSEAEIGLTAHMYEPGADDNASGVGLSIEIARAIGSLISAKRIPRPARGLRLIFGMEVRGTNSYLTRHPAARRLRAALNIDMVGADQDLNRSTCWVNRSVAANPAYNEDLVLHLMHRARTRNPIFRFRLKDGHDIDDNAMSEPMFNAPCTTVYQMPGRHWHVNADRPRILSDNTFSLLGVPFATYCLFLARAGYDEACWLADLTADGTRRRILDEITHVAARGSFPFDAELLPSLDDRFTFLVDQARRRIRSTTRLLEPFVALPTRSGWDYMESPDLYDSARGLRKDVLLNRRLDRLCEDVTAFVDREVAALKRRLAVDRGDLLDHLQSSPAPAAALVRKAERLVPRKTQPGFLAWDSIPDRDRRRFLRSIDEAIAWCAPGWAQSAILWCTGRRSLFDIWKLLLSHGQGVPLERLIAFAQGLARHGLLDLVPIITRKAIVRTLTKLGVRPGDILLAHSSLTRFGYVAGGPDAVIDAFLDVLGPKGTLVMPSFSFTRKGTEPFDRTNSPACTGLISETFRRRPDVLRSAHPSHSLCARGPLARDILRNHTHRRGVLAHASPFGRLYDRNAWVLMFAPPGANTIMHMGEYLAGIPHLDRLSTVLVQGAANDVTVREAPFHASFEDVYRALARDGKLRKARLRRNVVYLMKAKDAVDDAADVFRSDPLKATSESCNCAHCVNVRSHLARLRL